MLYTDGCLGMKTSLTFNSQMNLMSLSKTLTHPFRNMAFQNICSEGYTQFFSESALGMDDSSLAVDSANG